MARITIENNTQHRIYVPVPVGLSLGPRKRVTVGQVSDDQLAQSTKITKLIQAGVISINIEDNDPDVDDTIEKRLLTTGGTGAPLSNSTPTDVGSSGFCGLSTDASRADHQHAHSDLPGGSLHNSATPVTAGFMSSSDKQKLDTLGAGGDVTGPSSATDEAVARFDLTSGKLIQNSAVTIDNTGNISVPVGATVDGRDVSSDGTVLSAHVVNFSNPHSTSIANIAAGTLAQLNAKISDADLDDVTNPRTPTAHATSHKNGGSDEVATATGAANQIPKALGTGKLDSSWLAFGSSSGTVTEGNDTRLPTQNENDALQGTSGSPSNTNRYVTDADARNTNARTPALHASSHQHGGADEIAITTPNPYAIPKALASGVLAGGWITYGSAATTATEGNDSRLPSQDENDALQGTSGTPSNSNRYVTNADARNSDARTPTGSAGGQLGGSYPGPDVRGIRETSGPTLLTIGTIVDGYALIRSGSTIASTPLVGGGDVIGPAGATDNAIVRFDSTGGKLIKNSTVTIDNTGNVSLPTNSTVDGRDVSVDGAKLDTLVGGAITKEATGFPNLTSTTISFVGGASRTFTIAPTGASFDYYRHGVKITKSASEQVVLSNTTGLWFIYYDGSALLTANLSAWDLAEHVPVATVYWNSGTSTGFMGEERHGLVMDWATHQYLHTTVGTRYITGLNLDGYTLNTATDAAVTFGVSDGAVADEDIRISIAHSATPSSPFQQILQDPAEIPVFYRTGLNGDWTKDTATTFAFKNTSSGRVNFNQFTGGTWTQTQATNNYYVAVWIVATPKHSEPIISIQGQRQDANQQDAERYNSWTTLNLGTLPGAEMRLLYRVILQTNDTFGGTRLAKIQVIDDFRTLLGTPTDIVQQSVGGQPGLLANPQEPLPHAVRHLPGGVDALTTAAASGLSATTTSAEGSATSFARSDHTHAIDITNGTISTINGGDTASEGSGTGLSRRDHQHAVATAGPTQGIGASSSEGSSTSLARADHNHTIRTTSGPTDLTVGSIADGQVLSRSGSAIVGATIVATDKLVAISATDTTADYLASKIVDGVGITTAVLNSPGNEDLQIYVDFATVAPTNVTKAAAAIGTADRAAREDHKHDITTAAASGLSATTTNTEGAATSLARSDHTHAIDITNGTISTINGGDTAVEGTGTGLSRRDHQHAVATAAAGTVQIADSAAEGTSTSLARADHVHSVGTPAAPADVTKATAAAGAATTPARADHKHDVSTAAPSVGIGGANSEGTATSLARSDHNHTLRETSGPTNLTIGVITDGFLLQRSGTSIVGIAAGNVYDQRYTVCFDHFVSGNVLSDTIGTAGWRLTATGANNAVTLAAVAGHPGVVGMNPGTTAGGYESLHLGDGTIGTTFLVGGSYQIEYEGMIRILNSITAANLEGVQLGFGLQWSTVGQHASGVFIRFYPATDTTFVMVATNGGTASTSAGTTTVAVNTWYRIGFVITNPGTTPSVQMYVNGTAEGTPVTTNFPTVGLGYGQKIDAGPAVTSAPVLQLDYVRYIQRPDGT